MIAAGPAAIAARVAGLALLLAPPARGAERMPGLPEELAITRSIDVQDEDEFQTSLSASHLRFPHERSTTVRAGLEYGVTDRLQAIVEVPYAIRDPAGAHEVNGLEESRARVPLRPPRLPHPPTRARRRAHPRSSNRLLAENARRRRRLPRAELHAQPMARPRERPAELRLAAERDRWGGGGGRPRVRRRAPLSMARVVPHLRGSGGDEGERDGLLRGPGARLEAPQAPRAAGRRPRRPHRRGRRLRRDRRHHGRDRTAHRPRRRRGLRFHSSTVAR